jgi:hypothetical protein
MVAAGIVSLATTLWLSAAVAVEPGEILTRNTVRLSLAWYALALCMMIRLTAVDWTAATAACRLARWCWTWALVSFLVHLAMAFHYYHHWSHADAFEHTREVSGYGEGIYMSYLFTILWIVDVIWWWAQPERFARRSPWIDRALHAFMLFIVFNGMVVFESGLIRWAGLLLFTALLAVWLAARGLPRVRLT